MLRRRLAKAIKAADPDAHADRAKQAKTERRVELWDNPESDTCDLIGRNIDPADAHAIYNKLTAAAQAMKNDGDIRSINQIRLDLHNALLRGIPLPEAVRGLLISSDDTTAVAADALTAETQANAARARREGDDRPDRGRADRGPRGHQPAARHEAPADLTDVVAAVDKLIAHALAEAADEHLTALLDRARAAGRLDSLTLLIGQAVQTMNNALAGLVDSWCRATGTSPGHHGHPRYRPPAAMQRLIQRRHPTCVFPHCTRRATQCDVDHTVPYDKGGRTCKCNLAPLCRTHHRVIKQHPSWTLLQPWPGLLVWITPAGKWHIVTPQ